MDALNQPYAMYRSMISVLYTYAYVQNISVI